MPSYKINPDHFSHGWNHRPEDTRDYTIPYLLEKTSATPLHDLLKGVSGAFINSGVRKWAKAVTDLLEPPVPVPVPDPTPTPAGVVQWKTDKILDQGQTGHCVGFTGADFMGDDPVMESVSNDLGHTLYYECKVIDGEPGAENGSNMRSIAIALKNRGRITAYAFAKSIQEVVDWVTAKGPVMVGTDWYDGMFTPDAKGYVLPTGKIVGGHAWSIIGYEPATETFICQNHWGPNWAVQGLFRLHKADAERLLSGNGEAVVTVETPLS